MEKPWEEAAVVLCHSGILSLYYKVPLPAEEAGEQQV